MFLINIRKMLYVLSKNVTEECHKKMKYLVRIPHGQKLRCKVSKTQAH